NCPEIVSTFRTDHGRPAVEPAPDPGKFLALHRVAEFRGNCARHRTGAQHDRRLLSLQQLRMAKFGRWFSRCERHNHLTGIQEFVARSNFQETAGTIRAHIHSPRAWSPPALESTAAQT